MTSKRQLELENSELNDLLFKADQEIIAIMRYLNSTKFYKDPYVNISDMFLRLEELRSLVTQFDHGSIISN